MGEHPFGIAVTDDALRVSGEIDVAVAAELLDAVLCFGTSRDLESVSLDLGGVTFIDSCGVGALVEARKRLDSVGCRMLLTNVPDGVARVTGVSGLNEYLGVSTTVTTT